MNNRSERTGKRKICFDIYDSLKQCLSKKTVKSEIRRKERSYKRTGQFPGGDPSHGFYC